MGQAVQKLLDPNRVELVCFGDNSEKLQQSRADVCSIGEACRAGCDLMLIAVKGTERIRALEEQIRACGYSGAIACLEDISSLFDIRSSVTGRLAARIREMNVPGDVAELGVYRGDMAWQLNALFPDRELYLFDTFSGFAGEDVKKEEAGAFSGARPGDFSDTGAADVLSRMPHPERVIIRQGVFPETAEGLSDRQFAFVSMDADLYAPTLAGLEYFYPRLAEGGCIVLHDYDGTQFRGVRQAAADYEREQNLRLKLVPLADLHGSVVIVR